MRSAGNCRHCVGRLVWLLMALFSTGLFAAPGDIRMGDTHEATFPLLQTKTGVYTNVTVTKQTKDWIFILHSQGVCNIKATDLSTDTRIMLGYEAPAKTGAEAAASSSGKPIVEMARAKISEVKEFATGWRQNGKERMAQLNTFLAANHVVVYSSLGILGIVYMLVSTCFWLICRKTHNAPGPLVWMPILQLIPLLRAANMPRVWFFAYFVPVLNIFAMIMWSIKIVKMRGKSPWVAFLLVMPPTSLFAFLYLAFSRSAPVEIHSNEVLSLETA